MRNALILCLFLVGCASAEERDRITVDKQQRQYARQQPVPTFEWSLERDATIQIYKLRNEHTRTWTIWRSDTGIIEGHCDSVGYPIPYDVQLTNPLQPHGSAVIEQAEPNGLFSSKHATAMWVREVILKNNKTFVVPIFVSGKVTCYPYPIEVDYDKNRVTQVKSSEEPTIALKEKK